MNTQFGENRRPNENSIKNLKKQQLEDKVDEYREEQSHSGPRKRPRSETPDSDLEESRGDRIESVNARKRKRPRNEVSGRQASFQELAGDGIEGVNSQIGKRPYNEGSGQQGSLQDEFTDNPKMQKLFQSIGLSKNKALGKREDGRIEPVPLSTQKGRAGLGSKSGEFGRYDFDKEWDSSVEEKTVKETPSWLAASDEVRERIQEIWEDSNFWEKWMDIGKRKETIDDEDKFCDSKLLASMLLAKTVFDELSDRDLQEARTRANPYETIKCGFFQNRAAMKAANMDAVYEWIFTGEGNDKSKDKMLLKNPLELDENGSIKKGTNTDRKEPLFYFADVCAGPGGFSEYVLWRKGFYNAKGFGFTLKGKDDFKLDRFTAASPAYFEPFYGTYNDGDVTRPENITSFAKLIEECTDGKGVHLMMADGGFSVEGRENIQEILSKRLYLCQFLVALSIVREGGVFFCKLFDIFTPFSVGLIYLMYIAFEKISLHKPHTSRPANSERYIICRGLRRLEAGIVEEYFTRLNFKLDSLCKEKSSMDVNAVIPMEIIEADEDFMHYITEHNNRFLKRQILYLEKYKVFAKDHGKVDLDQGKLRDDCMDYWKLPKVERKRKNAKPESMMKTLTRLCNGEILESAELFKRQALFTEDVALDNHPRRMRYEELRMCALSERGAPSILFASENDIFLYDKSATNGFEKLHQPPRIPRNTLLLVQKTKIFKKVSDSNSKEKGKECSVFRILDAATIDSDDISSLPYDERMAAAEKMCRAVNCHSQTQQVPIYTAEVFKLDELYDKQSSFRRVCQRGEDSVMLKENNRYSCCCRGMRVVSILKDGVLIWSNSKKRCYIYDIAKKKSLYLEDEQARCYYTDFWTAALSKPIGNNRCVWFWDWTQNFVEGSYGPAAILEAEKHENGPTFASLKQIVDQTKECAR